MTKKILHSIHMFLRSVHKWFISEREWTQERTREKYLQNEKNIRNEALEIVMDHFPLLLFEHYDRAIYEYQLKTSKVHYHNQAVREIRALLKSHMEKRYRDNEDLKA